MQHILTVPYIDQTERWVCGCESVSAVMLLQYHGLPVQPDAFIDRYLPRADVTEANGRMSAPHPAQFYIGDPRSPSGWGCYAPCIVQALQNALAAHGAGQRFAVRDVTGQSAAALCEQYVSRGLPVVFWATLDMVPAGETVYWTLPSGEPFGWRQKEHCLLLVGWDEENFWFNDPWQNHGCCAYPRAVVEQRHAEQGLYAVVMERKEQ